jgi:hypothetical protein
MADSRSGKPPSPSPRPPRPAAARPAAARSAADVRKSRGRARRHRVAIVLIVVAGLLLALVGGSVYALKLAPVAAEKVLIVALFSRVPPVQRVAIRALRSYPTKHVALALVAFINLKNLQEVPDPGKPDPPEDQARRREQRVRDLALAERATETLCLLSGQSFGTYFKLERHGHSWGSLGEDKWPSVLPSVNGWALETFGPGSGR